MSGRTRFVVVWLFLAALVAPASGASGLAYRRLDAEPIELPALILTPRDLNAAGLGDYPIDQVGGMLQSPEAVAQEFIDFERVSAERARAVFVDSGPRQRYRHQYALKYPNDPVPAVYVARWLTTAVFEYPDAATAAEAFDDLARLLGRDAPELQGSTFGDESRLSFAEVPSRYGDATYPELTITFRSGRLIAAIAMRDDMGEPEPAEAEALATRLLARIATAAAGGPGLARLVLRFPAQFVMTGPTEGYTLFAGEVVVDGAPFVDVVRTWQADAARAAGAVDGYDLSNALVGEGGGWMADHGSMVYRFADAAAADAWLKAMPERLTAAGARNLTVTSVADIGDAAFVATYTSEPTDIIQHHRVDGVRVGALVALVHGTEVAPAAARALLAAQAACLAASGCAGPVAVPDGVLGYQPAD